jgi:lipoprotein-releasing system permease protein
MRRLAIMATVISVTVMLITVAFTKGFETTISNKVFGFFGHIRIQDYNTSLNSIGEEIPIIKNDSVLKLKNGHASIEKVQAYATKNALLKTPETFEGVLFKGVDTGYDFNALGSFLMEGRWVSFKDSGYSDEINVSASLAQKLQLKLQDAVLIFFIQPNGAAPRPRKLRVVGIYKTGIEEYDKVLAIGDLKLIQRLNQWRSDQVGGYEMFLKDPMQMDSISRAIIPDLPVGLNSMTIKEVFPSIFDWLTLQQKTIYIVLIIMIVIAILNLVTCLLIIVLERTRMIGLLKALGAPNSMLRRLFLYQGLVITVIGIVIGDIVGISICMLQQRFGFITLPEASYYISKAAVDLRMSHVLLIDGLTFIISLLILLIPSSIVQRIKPVKTIQFR